MTACACGHDQLGHPGGGPCMWNGCDCITLDTDGDMGAAERASRRMLGDDGYEIAKQRADMVWEQQHAQQLFTSALLAAHADVRDAQARLLVLAWWLTAVLVPTVALVVCWVVVT